MSGEQLGDLLPNLLDLTVEHLNHPDQSERDPATSRTLSSGQAWSRLSKTLKQGLSGNPAGVSDRCKPHLEASRRQPRHLVRGRESFQERQRDLAVGTRKQTN